MTQNDESLGFRKISYPYNIKNNLKFFEEEENANNGNINENQSYNHGEKENKIPNKKNELVTEEDNKEIEKKEIILETQLLNPEIMTIMKGAKKFNYNFDLINIDFKDFIHKFSFDNDENKNISNISSNISNKKSINDSYSNLSQSIYNSNSEENNKNNSGKHLILENGKKQINKNLLTCNCKNSSCLKFYCECFSKGKYCKNCLCCNCKNKEEFENIRQEKYKNIILRNPRAYYQIKSIKRSWTCNCKNSNCTKKYCDCFQNGKSCTSKCKCANCLNKIIKDNNYLGKKIGRTKIGIKMLKNSVYLTPKKRDINKNKGEKTILCNQSTADLSENHNANNNIFNNFSNSSKYKEIRLRLNMNDI